jgi:hypothetical protein
MIGQSWDNILISLQTLTVHKVYSLTVDSTSTRIHRLTMVVAVGFLSVVLIDACIVSQIFAEASRRFHRNV